LKLRLFNNNTSYFLSELRSSLPFVGPEICVILGFRRGANEIFARLACYAA